MPYFRYLPFAIDGVCVHTHIVQCHTKYHIRSTEREKKRANYNLKLLLLLGNSSSRTIFSHFEIIMAHINQLKPHISKHSLDIFWYYLFSMVLYIHLFVHSLTPTWIDHFDRIIPQYSSDQWYLIWFGSIAQAHLPLSLYHRSRHIILLVFFPILFLFRIEKRKSGEKLHHRCSRLCLMFSLCDNILHTQ